MKDKKNILWIIMDFHPFYTGHGIYLQKLYRGLRKKGYSCSVLTLNRTNKEKHYENIGGINVIRFNKYGGSKYFLFFCFSVMRYLINKRKYYRIIHMHGFYDRYGLITFLAKILGKKILFQMVLLDTDDPINFIRTYKFGRLRARYFSMIDMCVVISTPLEKKCFDAGLSAERVIKIFQGFDAELYVPVISTKERDTLKKELLMPDNAKIVLFVGAIIERKGIRTLLRTWSGIQKAVPDAHLFLVGPYVFKDAMEHNLFAEEMIHYAEEKNLNVSFVGYSEQVHNYMKAADIFVFPSLKEGFGNVIIEAMGCGLPCVVNYMDGVALDTVIHGETGYIFYNQEELQKYVILLLSDERLRTSISSKARSRAKNIFGFDVIVNQYDELYQKILRY